MRNPTVSYHNESTRALPSSIGGSNYAHYRPWLHMRNIINLIQLRSYLTETLDNDASEDPVPVGNGKKRALPPSSSDQRIAKKSKKEPSNSNRSSADKPKNNPYPDLSTSYRYPTLLRVDVEKKSTNAVPVHLHDFEIQFTSDTPNRLSVGTFADVHKEDWEAEERWFVQELRNTYGDVNEPLTIDLGEVEISKVPGIPRLAIGTNSLCIDEDVAWLLLLPECNLDRLDVDTLDLHKSSEDLLLAFAALSARKRAKLDVSLKMVLLPEAACDSSKNELPFRFQIQVKISLIIPRIFEPFQDRSNVELDDARRRVLLFLYPLSPPPPSFEGTVNVPFYYSVMKPAPALPTKEIEDSIQPEELIPTLLPFQRRTVAWMLDREGMGLSSDGTVVSKVATSDFNFWKEVHEGDHTWYLHRLAGLLSPRLPNSESEFSTQGGILAEEPGLGKTVETIALIALNPPSEDRNPSVKSWDPATELEIKAVKSTLIVTPAALATQWQDEFKTHAPHLKVLFYDGWSNVKVPISQSQIEKEKERRAQEKLKARRRAARAKSRAESKKNIAKRGKAYDQPIDLEDSDNDEEEEIVDWVAFAHSFDVVITTYNVLQGDLNVARAPPTRPRRDGVVYSNLDRPRSPLVMVEWNRVVMDEVQMAGGGKTEDMVSLIPRLTSFAVSGTPARTQVADLIHVLRFLRVNQFIGGQKMWLRLIKPGYASLFADFFGHYSVRTMKSTVNDELTIPQQTRYLVSIEMGRVERHVYDQTLEEVLLLLGLDARGVAASQGWEIDGALLRMSIRKLRGICTHPQVGQLLRTNEKSNKATGTLKSMAEVLEMMKDQNWRNMMDDWKSKAQGLVMIAQLQLMKSRAKNQLNTVLETLTAGEKETLKLRKEIETAIAEHKVKGEALKKEAAALRAERSLGANEGSNDKGKGKERASSPSDIEDEEEEDDDEENEDDRGLPKTPAGREHRDKGRALRQRLREAMIVLHRVKFLQGDVYHNLGPTESANEDKSYGDAELLRRNLLKFTADKAEEIMTQLKQCKRNTTKKGVSEEDLMIPVPYLEQGGIRSADLVTELDAIIEDVLNPQTELLWEWRTKLHALLTTSLNPADNDSADGGEYQRTLDDQGEAEVYLQAYQALIADRREALVNERTLLAAHDDRETKQRKTKAALKAIAAVDDDLMLPLEGEMRPEDEVLQKQLALTRRDLVKDLKGRSVKSILVEHSAALLRITRDSDPEKALIIDNIKEIRTLMSSQQAHLLELDADLVVFRRAFNQRVLYFRQLQEISDSVAEVEFEGTREEALARAQVQQGDFEAKLNTSRARQRYLDHLTMTQDGGEGDDDEKCCILCRCEFDRGYITLCAHIFCEGCMNMWMKKVQGKVCPVCRVPVNVDNLQRFSIHNPEQPPPRIVNGEAVPSSKRKIEYNIIDPKLFEQIQSVESYGDFGVKIQTLVRHLLYLQLTEPGTKSIVFSAWADSLHIVERALRENGIRSLRIDSGGKGKGAANKFKTDPDILVLLLHGERENAGLNVTCASRVFLLESVVHHGFELQAIARVDRMGQTKPTEVYCYYAEDTIERNILDLAAKRGLSLYTKENSTGTVNVSTFVADQEKKVEALAKKNASKTQKGDFISQIDDMLAILFPHMYEDVEYLIPEDTVMGNITNTLENNHHAGETGRLGKRSSGHVEAVAGPSRLH